MHSMFLIKNLSWASKNTDLIDKKLSNFYKKSEILKTKIEKECNKDDQKIIVKYLKNVKIRNELGFFYTFYTIRTISK